MKSALIVGLAVAGGGLLLYAMTRNEKSDTSAADRAALDAQRAQLEAERARLQQEASRDRTLDDTRAWIETGVGVFKLGKDIYDSAAKSGGPVIDTGGAPPYDENNYDPSEVF